MGSGRGASLQKSATPGIVRIKAGPSITETAKQRRRMTDGTSVQSPANTGIGITEAKNSMMEATKLQHRTTACKRRKKAQIASSSLAAEEQFVGAGPGKTNFNYFGKDCQPLPSTTVQGLCVQHHGIGRGLLQPAAEMVACEPRQILGSFMKLKLQLFPIDNATCKGLEKDEHNPHLELTLGAQKKISSVLKHLNSKWGSSHIALGELMLFPFDVQKESLTSYRRWTVKDTDVSAGDVFATIGSPAIFRLRYGWFSHLEIGSSQMPLIPLSSEDHLQYEDIQKAIAHPKITCGDDQTCQDYVPTPDSNLRNPTAIRPIPLDQIVENADYPRTESGTALLSEPWTENLTNISFSDLLMKASVTEDASACGTIPVERDLGPQQIPFTCDSFDAAIAAIISGPQGSGPSLTAVSNASILDCEETCHAFPFQKIPTSSVEEVPAPSKDSASLGSCSQAVGLCSSKSHDLVEVNPQVEHTQQNCACQEEPACDSGRPDNVEHSFGMTDICWQPDSLGPFNFGIPSKQIIGGDSMSLSSLIGNSLEAFQNCSFFSKDQKVSNENQEG